MKKTVFLMAAATLLMFPAMAVTEEPSHPLRHIHPINTDLNMSEQDIYNVTEIRVLDGFDINGYDIRTDDDDGNLPLLSYEGSTNMGSQLNLSVPLVTRGNNIESGGSSIVLRDTANSQDIARLKEGGKVEIPNGDINFPNNNDIRSSGSDAIRLQGGQEVQIPNGNLNMKGNNITNIDTLKFETGMQINGSINTSGGSVNLDNGSINNVYSIDGGGDAVEFDDSIDMNGNRIFDIGSGGSKFTSSGGLNLQNRLDMQGNNILDPGLVDDIDLDSQGNGLKEDSSDRYAIKADGVGANELNESEYYTVDGLKTTSAVNMTGENIQTGGGDVAVRDTRNSKDIAIFHQDSQDVEMPDGNLLGKTGELRFGGGEFNIDAVSGADVQIRNDADNIVIDAEDGGNVRIPNGNLEMDNNIVDNPDRIDTGSGSSDSLTVRDGSQGNTLAEFSNGGPVRFYNPVNNNVALSMNTTAGSEVNVPSGNLDLENNNIDRVETLNSDGSTTNIDLKDGGNVEVPNGNLDVTGGKILIQKDTPLIKLDDTGGGTAFPALAFSDSGNKVVRVKYDGGSQAIKVETVTGGNDIVRFKNDSQKVAIPNGDLNFPNNNDIRSSGTDAIRLESGQKVSVPNGDLQVDSSDLYVDRSIDSVGINTSSPSTTLEVNGDLNVTGTSYLGDTTIQSDEIKVDTIQAKSSGIKFEDSSSTERMRMDDQGDLGIGTTNPQQDLDVEGSASVSNSGTNLNVESDGDVVITLGSG